MNDESFSPPEAVRKAAARGLRLRRQFKRGGLSTREAGRQGIGSGVARATSLSDGDAVSASTIRRMVSYFARHESDKQAKGWGDESNPSAGYIAWLLWRGDPGRAWANKIARSLESGRKSDSYWMGYWNELESD